MPTKRRRRKAKRQVKPRLFPREMVDQYITVNKEMWENEPLFTQVPGQETKMVNLLRMIAENTELKNCEKALYYYDRNQLPPVIVYGSMRFAFEFNENQHKLTNDVRKFIEKAMKKYGYEPLYGK